VLAKRFKIGKAKSLVPGHPTLGDVDSPQALLDYQAAKREHKKEWSEMRSTAGKPAASSRSRSTASVRKTGSR
jgi:hypothetical protein